MLSPHRYPLASHALFHTRDVDQAREAVARVLKGIIRRAYRRALEKGGAYDYADCARIRSGQRGLPRWPDATNTIRLKRLVSSNKIHR